MNRTENCVEEKLVSEIGTKYSTLRIVNPSADSLIEKSIEKFGQMSPVVCAKDSSGTYELIDGFKRLRAFRKLNKNPLKIITMQAAERVYKAAMIQLNRVARSINDIEEAMVLQSLVREDQLTQIEISTLIGKHKSWVSRRISLIEKLNSDILKEIEMGLVTVSIGRELAKLPCGNQIKTLSSIRKHRLNANNTASLVNFLQTASKNECSAILADPWEFLKKKKIFQTGFKGQLITMQRLCMAISKRLKNNEPTEIKGFSGLIKDSITSGEELLKRLKSVFETIVKEDL